MVCVRPHDGPLPTISPQQTSSTKNPPISPLSPPCPIGSRGSDLSGGFHDFSKISILEEFRLPTFSDLGLPGRRFRRLPDLQLDALPGAQDLALEVETAAVGGFVGVEEPFEAGHDVLHVCLAGLRGPHVEDLAGFVEGEAVGGEGDEAGRGRGGGGAGLFGVLGGGGGLAPGFGEGTTEDTGADDEDLGYDAVGLEGGGGREVSWGERRGDGMGRLEEGCEGGR